MRFTAPQLKTLFETWEELGIQNPNLTYYDVFNIKPTNWSWKDKQLDQHLAQIHTAGKKHFQKVIQQATKIVRQFGHQLVFDKEDKASVEIFNSGKSIGISFNVEGQNQLGAKANLFELRLRQDINQPVDIEVFSYNIDNEGTIDPTALTPHTKPASDGAPVAADEVIKWLQKGYRLEDSLDLSGFTEPWHANLAWFCWATPQLQNEQGMDQQTMQHTLDMRHNEFLQNNELGLYKLLTEIGIVHGEGTPQNLVDQHGSKTRILGKFD